jgi:ABC-type nickel/cobalt efflux system permease component RcnA
VDRATAAFTALVGERSRSSRFALVAILLAVVLGGAHALAPGHGKTVMAAYLVGLRGTLRQALTIGATVTVTHTAGPPLGRRGLVALGLAGGLVPSPSAVVVLLGGIAIGRAWFGVALVLAYGLGMAATLTGVGLLLARLRTRMDRRLRLPGGSLLARLGRLLPAVTASVIVLVGLGLAIQGVAGI